MTTLQLLMLLASGFFAFKIFQHVQTLQDPEEQNNNTNQVEQKTAKTFSPFDPEALIEKADEAYEQKDYQKALALLIEANAKESNNPDILFKIGYIFQLIDDTTEALNYYKEALEVDKNNEYIHNSIASAYRARGEFASAKLHLEASLSLDGTNPITYYNFGNLLVDMKHVDEAKEMYKKALDLDGDFAEAKEELEKL
ncbi:MAG: tetratricopeptide repeat protein [Sulfurimonas sp.]|uniref:tetratricopeptide repeat protein n=1 Tax=Sulfurimonas sp. TaxID=2022749 RepID=UPI0025CE5744|nr:tetratricopeptide repeat protein [Sulfurimonas sp.]MCK9491966.1 tetratricopeptide repeat protein [Sulfurimonas sp.]